jgi:glycosyltransferase involved in cell wall biosynthesis
MRILYVIDSLVPSGAERSLAALAPEYAAQGVGLDVAYLHDRPGLQDELAGAGAGLTCLAGPGGRAGLVSRARRLIRDRSPDLVHTTLLEADLIGRVAARLARVPVVTSWVNPAFGPEHLHHPGVAPWKVQLGLRLDRLTARGAARFHAITAYIGELMRRTLRVPPDRVEVIPRGRDPAALGRRTGERRLRARQLLGVTDEDPVLLCVARQDRQKGLDVLIRGLPAVLERHPSARLLVVGREGNATALLKTLVDEGRLGHAVRFVGLRDDVPDLLCGADVFVLPSRWEGLGSVLLEAMALEAPIVASDIPPIREVVEHASTALLPPPERPNELAGAVSEVLGDPEAAGQRARAARRRFMERFTIGGIAREMVAFYRRALDG